MMLVRGYSILALFLASAFGMKLAYAEQVGEYELKTAYLYNFALFTAWPASWAPETGGTMAICTIGQDQFGTAIDQLHGRKIRGKRLVVRRAVTLDEAATCHILYITQGEYANMPKIFETLRNTSVLTVSDMQVDRANALLDETHNAVPQRCIITLILENKKLLFEVDAAAAKRAGLSLSSRLLYLARHVY